VSDADRLLAALHCDPRCIEGPVARAEIEIAAREMVRDYSASDTFRWGIDYLRDELATRPHRVLASAPAILGDHPTVRDFEELLDLAEAVLSEPQQALEALTQGPVYGMPPDEHFEGYDPGGIPIDPTITKFEETDWAGWALTAVEAAFFRLRFKKPALPPFNNTSFRYPLRAGGESPRIALFSDWGTGYYHSQYIAKHLGAIKPDYAIHLGDIYYTGRDFEVTDQFETILDRYISKHIPFFALNANHEMDSNGIAYFNYLARKRAANPSLHEQESSFFTVFNDGYQITAIDTAYHRPGRFENGAMFDWLAAQLEEGRNSDRVNILLSQNEPFRRGKEEPNDLLHHLSPVIDMVDLWFWGDEHYAAVHGPNPPAIPFFGCCIGHGGYPYERIIERCALETRIAPLLYAETGMRFAARRDRGANGFIVLTLNDSALDIAFIDWRRRARGSVRLATAGGRIDPNPNYVEEPEPE
jgi:hypothetical protein